MTLDRTKPPPGFVEYIPDFDGAMTYIIAEANEHAHYVEGWSGHTLADAWDYYDRITLPARVALLRELAAEFDRPDPVRPPPYDDTLDRTLAEAVSSNNDPHGAIAIELLRRADALEAGK